MKNPFEKPKAVDKPGKPKKSEKSQTELRKALEERLLGMKGTIKGAMEEYEQALNDSVFKDKEDEPEGAGEQRRATLQAKINAFFDRAEQTKKKLNSKGDLPQTSPEISTTYTHPDGQQEIITLDIEAKLQDFVSFYQKTKVNLPPDFEDTIRDIWERSQTEIEQAVEQNGFDGILLVPGDIPLADLAEKMKMENGYYFYQVKNDFSDITSQKVEKSRIILFHHVDSLTEITQKTGLDVHLNITGAEAQKLYQTNPENYLSTIEDALVLERKYFEETGKHLSDWTTKSAQWLPGSKSGSRLVNANWNPGAGRLEVNAHALDYQFADLGARPSRSFF